MTNPHLELLARIRQADGTASIPTPAEMASHLAARREQVGAVALAEFAYVQRVAAEKWGAGPTAHFGRVLRDARVRRKAPRKTAWQRAEESASRLPAEWRPVMDQRIATSKCRRSARGEVVWSAANAKAVADALTRWAEFCNANGLDSTPTGAGLERYARWIGEERDTQDHVSVRGIADYLTRIVAGYKLVDSSFHSMACDFVIRDWRERAACAGSPTKTGSQLVTATAIYDLGLVQMNRARDRNMRGVQAAKDFRNGLILSIGAMLPQRARALSALEFDRTLCLLGEDAIRITIPAAMLKLLESEKDDAPFERVLSKSHMHKGLTEYRRAFRPLFDDGSCLFPSLHAPGAALSEMQIGTLAGDMTEKAFNVRIPIHRIRDNVATEASERLPGGAYLASRLLGHRRTDTTSRHYDRSQGLLVTEEFGASLASRRRAPVDLAL